MRVEFISHVTYASCLLLLVRESLFNPDIVQAALQRCHPRAGRLNNRVANKHTVFLLHLHRLATLDIANSITEQNQGI